MFEENNNGTTQNYNDGIKRDPGSGRPIEPQTNQGNSWQNGQNNWSQQPNQFNGSTPPNASYYGNNNQNNQAFNNGGYNGFNANAPLPPNATYNNYGGGSQKLVNTKRTGLFIGALVCTIATILFQGLAWLVMLQGIGDATFEEFISTAGIWGFIALCFLNFSWVLYFVGFFTLISGMVLSFLAIKSSSKAIKGFSIFFAVLNIIFVVAIIAVFFLLLIMGFSG